jgi:hypothetical protein
MLLMLFTRTNDDAMLDLIACPPARFRTGQDRAGQGTTRHNTTRQFVASYFIAFAFGHDPY